MSRSKLNPLYHFRIDGYTTAQVRSSLLPMGPPSAGTDKAKYWNGLALDQWKQYSVPQRLYAWSTNKSLSLLHPEVARAIRADKLPVVHPVFLVPTANFKDVAKMRVEAIKSRSVGTSRRALGYAKPLLLQKFSAPSFFKVSSRQDWPKENRFKKAKTAGPRREKLRDSELPTILRASFSANAYAQAHKAQPSSRDPGVLRYNRTALSNRFGADKAGFPVELEGSPAVMPQPLAVRVPTLKLFAPDGTHIEHHIDGEVSGVVMPKLLRQNYSSMQMQNQASDRLMVPPPYDKNNGLFDNSFHVFLASC